MRILIATTANDGHFGPLVGVGRAAASAGHEVRVAAPESFTGAVARAGLTHQPFADAPPELIGPVMARLPTLPPAEADATVLREVFARIDAQAALPGVMAGIREWAPDVVVREAAELGSLAAAERYGVPHVQVAIGMSEMVRSFTDAVDEPLEDLARVAGLPAGSLSESLRSEPLLSCVPEVLDRAGDDTADEGPPVALRYRDDASNVAAPPFPEWGDPNVPLVYVTFGTVAGLLPPFAGVFREALDALADLPVRVFMTAGRRVDMDALGPVPANAWVEPWWPQADVLARAAVVLGHGGFGTTMGAVAAGVPQVVAPLFSSDQAVNARHVAALGLGRTVAPGAGAVERACSELPAVLDGAEYLRAARSTAAAFAAQPAVTAAVTLLERRVLA